MTAPPAPTAIPVDVPTLVSDVRWALDRVSAEVDSITRSVESHLSALPDFIADDLRQSLVRLREQVDAVTSYISDRIAVAGDPALLMATASTWITGIGGPVSGNAGIGSFSTAQADDYWTGLAGDAYRNTLPAQLAALTAIEAIGADINSTLTEVASAITTYWISVSTAALAFAAGAETAALTAATILGIPAGVGLLVGITVAFVNAVNDAIKAVDTIAAAAAGRGADLQRRLFNDLAFPQGTWPRSTVPITADASITDGDVTDWHLK